MLLWFAQTYSNNQRTPAYAPYSARNCYLRATLTTGFDRSRCLPPGMLSALLQDGSASSWSLWTQCAQRKGAGFFAWSITYSSSRLSGVPSHLFPLTGLPISQTSLLVEKSAGSSGKAVSRSVELSGGPAENAVSPHHQAIVATTGSLFWKTRTTSSQPFPRSGAKRGLERLLV